MWKDESNQGHTVCKSQEEVTHARSAEVKMAKKKWTKDQAEGVTEE